jgi:phage gp36-like protein
VAYITTADLSRRLGATLYARLTDRVNGTAADATVAETIVAEAESEADSYLAARYATPVSLSAHPELADVLARRVLDLAEYCAWCGSPFVSDIPARVKALYQEACSWLSRVAAGVPLPAGRAPAPSEAVDDAPLYRAKTRAFTADELDGL